MSKRFNVLRSVKRVPATLKSHLEFGVVVKRCLRVSGFRHHTVTVNGAPVHLYRAKGRGDLSPLVLIPSLSGGADVIAWVAHSCRRNFREVVIVELPGNGDSRVNPGDSVVQSRREALSFITKNVLKGPFFLAGSSFGGTLVMDLATNTPPANMLGFVAIGPGGADVPAEEHEATLRRLKPQTDAEAVKLYRLSWRGRPPKLAGRPPRSLIKHFQSEPYHLLIDELRDLGTFSSEGLGRSSAPGVVLCGELDRVLPPSSANFWKGAFSGNDDVAVKMIKNWGHASNLQSPRSVANEIATFARQVELARPQRARFLRLLPSRRRSPPRAIRDEFIDTTPRGGREQRRGGRGRDTTRSREAESPSQPTKQRWACRFLDLTSLET